MPLPYASSTSPASHGMTSYFPMSCSDTSWMYSEELSGEPSIINPKPSPIYASPTFQPQYSDYSRPLGHGSGNYLDFSNCDTSSTKITEGEIWNLPSSTDLTNDGTSQDMFPATRPSSYEHSRTTSATENNLDRNFFVKRANSNSEEPHHYSQNSSSAESQPLPKRRHSSTGGICKPEATQTTDAEAKLGSADREPEARSSAKSSHSVIERRYRENLNTKITQLDHTLSDIRHANDQPGDPKFDDHPNKTRKADVLNEAIRYVKQAELESQTRIKEIDFLRLRVAALEKLVICPDCALLKHTR